MGYLQTNRGSRGAGWHQMGKTADMMDAVFQNQRLFLGIYLDFPMRGREIVHSKWEPFPTVGDGVLCPVVGAEQLIVAMYGVCGCDVAYRRMNPKPDVLQFGNLCGHLKNMMVAGMDSCALVKKYTV